MFNVLKTCVTENDPPRTSRNGRRVYRTRAPDPLQINDTVDYTCEPLPALVFATVADAQAWIDARMPELSVSRSGRFEHSPSYTIIRV